MCQKNDAKKNILVLTGTFIFMLVYFRFHAVFDNAEYMKLWIFIQRSVSIVMQTHNLLISQYCENSSCMASDLIYFITLSSSLNHKAPLSNSAPSCFCLHAVTNIKQIFLHRWGEILYQPVEAL